VRFYPGKGTGYRHLMVMKDAPKNLQDIFFYPPHDIMGKDFLKHYPKEPEAQFLMGLMDLSREIFLNHAVNIRRKKNGKGLASMIWLWGQGFSPKLPTFYEKYGIQGGLITAVDLLKGIAIFAGLDVIRVPGVTGYFDTNYIGKAEFAVNALRSRDFVVIHIESTDEGGHSGDPELKIRAIEDVDRMILGTLKNRLESEFESYRILLVPDHFTCVETRTHSSDPVPFFVFDSLEKQKGPKKFSEKSAKDSGLVIRKGHELIDSLFKKENE
jgi:2,3-bisphosphoglycerate-independent phosphoglycerate mutase